jgi:hypothetical protein
MDEFRQRKCMTKTVPRMKWNEQTKVESEWQDGKRRMNKRKPDINGWQSKE